MDIQRIRPFHDQRPVRPFTIHTASGESYTVRHPERMAIGAEDGVILVVPGPGKLAMIDMSNIVEVTTES